MKPGASVFLRALSAWALIIAIEIAHGVLRRLLVTPLLGEHRANQLGVLVGVALTAMAAILLARWIGARRVLPLLLVGLLWVGLTLLFEVGLGLALGYDLTRIAADYQLAKGGWMPVGLLAMLFTPLAAARLRGVDKPSDPSDRRRMFGEALPYPANDDG